MGYFDRRLGVQLIPSSAAPVPKPVELVFREYDLGGPRLRSGLGSGSLAGVLWSTKRLVLLGPGVRGVRVWCAT